MRLPFEPSPVEPVGDAAVVAPLRAGERRLARLAVATDSSSPSGVVDLGSVWAGAGLVARSSSALVVDRLIGSSRARAVGAFGRISAFGFVLVAVVWALLTALVGVLAYVVLVLG